MLTRSSWIWLVLLLCACSGVRCGPEQPKEPAARPAPTADLRLFLLTDPKGYLEPCGCQQRPLGGVARLATALAQGRAGDVPNLLLAAGDLTAGMEIAKGDESSAATQETWRAETLVEVWRDLGLVAACPGPLDLVDPAATSALIRRGGFPWLLENATDDARTRLPVVRAGLFTAGPIKVGVFGLIAPDPGLPASVQAALDPSELGAFAERTAAALRSKGAQVVVALLSADRRVARDVAGKGVDVIVLGGPDTEQPIPPAVQRGTIIVNAGRQGQRLLVLDLTLGAGAAEPFHDESAWTRDEARKALQADERELAGKIESWQTSGGVDARDLEAQRARLASLRAQLQAPAQPRYEGRWFDAQVLELSPDVAEEPAIGKRLNAYDLRVNEHNRTSLADRMPAPVAEGQAGYVGSERCQSCHQAAYTWWKGTPHGHAYETLSKVHKEFNLSCVGCHVTGYNRPGGSTVTHVAALKDVGCENCHGPGSAHIAEGGASSKITRLVPESTCRGCHTPEHSDHFIYDPYRSMLIMPGHGRPKVP